MIKASRWYKCDLQVATPAWKFKLPHGSSYNFSQAAHRTRFADTYMTQLRSRGIDVIALADHNTGNWLPDMQAAGKRHGVVVFPGVEVTTASGADGAHLVLIGDLDRTKEDIDVLLARTCGFNDDHPRLNPQTGAPAPAPLTADQILDGLPDQWLALAPHVLSENGLASKGTLRGDLRWKALHHDRLGAVDPGDVTTERLEGDSYTARFLNRKLTSLPCLTRLPFIASSDAYCLEDLGNRYTWIRMEAPSKEALRQAFLDHEARIITSWDIRLTTNPDPNVVEHGWVESIELTGKLGNSNTPLRVAFDPRLNVIIGGRGSGKSTIVSALRQVYGRTDNLPTSIKHEVETFIDGVFNEATLSGRHQLAISRELQAARWSKPTGSQTKHQDAWLPTHFPMRIFSQKELFERTAHDRLDRFAASRHLLSLVDEALEADSASPEGFEDELSAAMTHCYTCVAERLDIEARLATRPMLEARRSELFGQIQAFGDAASQSSRMESEQLLIENAQLGAVTTRFDEGMEEALEGATKRLASSLPRSTTTGQSSLQDFYNELIQIQNTLEASIQASVRQAQAALGEARERHQHGPWGMRIAAAEREILTFQEHLSTLGIEPTAYLELTEALNSVQARLRTLDQDAEKLDYLRTVEATAWADLERIYDRRRRRRETLLLEVKERSQSLRFEVHAHGNSSSWTRQVRNQLSIRSDGFLEDVPAVANWLWEGSEIDRQRRVTLWREGLLSSDLSVLREEVNCKVGWWSKLEKLEITQRIHLAMLLPDDAVTMYFLRDGGKKTNNTDWQAVTTGSPGQRSAAMLSFVLHHGTEPLVLDQPEDDLDTAWISQLIVPEIRKSRWRRQVIVITHNANIPVNADAERVIVLENDGARIRIKRTVGEAGLEGLMEVEHSGPIEVERVRLDIQNILEGGTEAFMARERRYNNELNTYRAALRG